MTFSLRVLLLAALPLMWYSCDTPNDGANQDGAHHHTVPETKAKSLSPHTSAMGNIGDAHVHIDYSSPGKRGRMIWGGLVAYDRVWSAGAHNATSVDFSEDVRIAGQKVPADTYAFFTIPGRKTWTLILNKNYEQHLADDYDEAEDVLRVEVEPTVLNDPTESLIYVVAGNGKGRGGNPDVVGLAKGISSHSDPQLNTKLP